MEAIDLESRCVADSQVQFSIVLGIFRKSRTFGLWGYRYSNLGGVTVNRVEATRLLSNLFQLVLDDDHSGMQPFRFLPIFTDEPSIGTLKHVTRWSAFLFKLPLSDTVLLAFRGTDNPEEWLTDFDQSPSPLPEDIYAGSHKISVHRGFLNLYLRLRNQIFAGLQSLKPKSILIAGHSLGASLAS